MPKEMGAHEHAGCLVSGRILDASGHGAVKSFTVKPEHGAMVGGVWYPAHEASIAVGPDGKWSATLLPSSAVGRYLVRIDRQRFRLIVPDAASAAFGAIAEPLQEA